MGKAIREREGGKDIVARLRELGYRLTSQRMMVLKAMQNSSDHISAEEIYEQGKAMYPRLNISTVYRTLELLHSLGLVTETDLGEGKVRYHFGEKGHHHHLLCQKCGRVSELDEGELLPLREVLRKKYGFMTDLRHLAIFGWCSSCWAKEEV